MPLGRATAGLLTPHFRPLPPAVVSSPSPSHPTRPSTAATPLQCRTFATWTLTSCMLCALCAAHPTSKPLYDATLGSFAIAFGHFVLECFVYGTARKGAVTPLIISSLSLTWMVLGRGVYTFA